MTEHESVPDTQAEPGQVGESATADQPAVYENRAARRAKGKGASGAQSQGTGLRAGGRGTVQSPRQYGSRRSG